MIKRILHSTPGALLLAALVVLGACKKEAFTEADVLKLMQETDYTLRVQEPYTKAGVAGAKVIVVQDGKTITRETDANGIVHFSSLKVGSTHVTVTKDQYLAFNDKITVEANAREGQRGKGIDLYYLGNDQKITAVIRGRITIQTDLTTRAPEVPTGLVVKAILVGTTSNPYDNSYYPVYYPYDGYAESYIKPIILTATVDAEGKFVMNIPVGLDGRHVRLKLPITSHNQKLEMPSDENPEIRTSSLMTKLTSFDPYASAMEVPAIGANISKSNPSGFEWPNGSGFMSYYEWYSQPYYQPYYVKPGTVVDLKLDYGTGTAREN